MKLPDVSPHMCEREKRVVAHVNYHFFPSTQTFIYFYLSHFQSTYPICLTRSPESMSVDAALPPSLAEDFYLYSSGKTNRLFDMMFRGWDLFARKAITRLPLGLVTPIMDRIHRNLVPVLKSETDANHYLDWAESIIRRRNACLIHAYFGPVGWRLLALKRKLKLPFVVTFLGDEIASSLKPWWNWWIQSGSQKPDWPLRLRELFNEADLLLAEGPFLRQRVIDLGCPPEKIQIQRFAIPVGQMPFRCRGPKHDGKVIVIFAGRFCEQKGLLYALEAVRELWTEQRGIEFRIIGDERLTGGEYAVRVYSYIRRHHLERCVRLLGFLNHKDYVRAMQEGDIFIHPSVTTADGASEGGAPTTILEAQALGMPVVSTYHCDIPNVTVPGHSAILVPERDREALAQALKDLVNRPERWKEMGLVGRRRMEQLHDIEREAPALEDKYFHLMNG